MYLPQLIEAGRVYKAVPPLYSISNGKSKESKTTYFTNQVSMVMYNQKNFAKDHVIKDVKSGKVLTNQELTTLFVTNVDYVYELERISATYAMDPELMEMVLLNYYNHKSSAALKKQVKSTYRFMDVTKKNGVDIVEGTIDKSYKLYVTDRLINDCKIIFDIYRENISTVYDMDSKECSLYEIMKAYDDCMPSNLQRYKGLGEMDVEDITESTMSPYAQRTLVRYTIEDVKDEIESMRIYESDLSKLLDLTGKVSRDDLLD